MSEFNFDDDFLCAPAVKHGILEDAGDKKVYWLNGTGRTHSALMKLIGDEKSRQDGWIRSVYELASDEKGIKKYQGNVSLQEFAQKVDHALVRSYGMMILGISKGGDESDFEIEVETEKKPSRKGAETSKG